MNDYNDLEIEITKKTLSKMIEDLGANKGSESTAKLIELILNIIKNIKFEEKQHGN
jgi:predicted HNH restriction endonuclease